MVQSRQLRNREARTPLPQHHDVHSQWGALDFISTREDISPGIEWTIHDKRHAVIVHLGGTMNALETELDGNGMSCAPANVGEIWSIPSGMRYVSRAQGGTIDYAVIFIQPDIVSRLCGEDVQFSRIAAVHGWQDEYCLQATRQLVSCIGDPNDVTQMLGESISLSLCLYLYRRYGDVQAGLANPQDDCVLDERTVCQLREYVQEHLADSITLDKLAAEAGMSKHHFLIVFRRAFGQTPAQYVIAQRLRKARWLLAHSIEDITSIAYATGFSSHSHLTTTFKRCSGYTPSAYRRYHGTRGGRCETPALDRR
ncbi:MAG: helix-turn-helix transcriptional regulator [Gammaproteobacteria bacterium]|nr:helix-turn-helix transcriptional regulator [Gammaproteobacteria bacterium]